MPFVLWKEKMRKIAVIPALNPEENLKQLVEENRKRGNTVVLVDDGSDDEHQHIFSELKEEAVVLRHQCNRGKRAAVKTALTYIQEHQTDCDVIGIMDADGQHLPEDLERVMVKAGQTPKALVLGVRKVDRAMPWRSRLGNLITRNVFRILSGTKVSDTQTGLRAFSAELLDFMLKVEGERYEYETNVLLSCCRQGTEIIEVPAQTIYLDRENSSSHFRGVRDSLRIYRDILKFAMSSLSSFVLDYLLFALFTVIFPAGTLWTLVSNVAARLISAFYNYTMNCRFVFHTKRQFRTAADYILLAGFILLMNNLVLSIFIQLLHMPVYGAKLMTEQILFLISYFVQNRLIFTARRGV